jgi:hypothetical protein
MPDAVREDEIASILARLREEVRHGPASSANGPAAALPIRLTARQDAERLWPVTADRPLQRRAGPIELILGPIRVVLRKAMRWYVEPAFADQREFNAAALELIDDLAERTSAGLTRLERALPESPDLPDAGPYADDLRGAAPVLSCDSSDALGGVGEGVLGGVVFLAPDRPPSQDVLAGFLAAAFGALRPGGVLVVEAGGSVGAEVAAGQARESGFGRVDVRFGAGPHGYALVVRK